MLGRLQRRGKTIGLNFGTYYQYQFDNLRLARGLAKSPSASCSVVGTNNVTIVVPGTRRRGLWLMVPRGKDTLGTNDTNDFSHSTNQITMRDLTDQKLINVLKRQ